MAKIYRNSPVIGDGGLQTKPGDNSQIVEFGQKLMDLPTVDIHDPEALAQRIDSYFSLCAIFDQKPGAAGLALSLGIDRRRLWEAARDRQSDHRSVNNMPPECRSLIKKAFMFLEYNWENLTQNFKLHPTAAVFLGINNFQYMDVKQVAIEQVEPADLLRQNNSIAEIEARIASLPLADE